MSYDPHLPPGCTQSQIDHWYGDDSDVEAIENELLETMAVDAIGPFMYDYGYFAADRLSTILAANPEDIVSAVEKVRDEILCDEYFQEKAARWIEDRNSP